MLTICYGTAIIVTSLLVYDVINDESLYLEDLQLDFLIEPSTQHQNRWEHMDDFEQALYQILVPCHKSKKNRHSDEKIKIDA